MTSQRRWAAPAVGGVAMLLTAALAFAGGGPAATADELLASSSASPTLTEAQSTPTETGSAQPSALSTPPAAGTDRYIVVAESGQQSAVAADIDELGGSIVVTYNKALPGFAVDLTEAQAAELDASAAVKTVERDAPMTANAGAIISDAGCLTNALPRADDASSTAVSLGFSVNWFGTEYSKLYVNSNGGVAFDNGRGGYSDYLHNITTSTRPIILPLGTDVDTRNNATTTVTYGALTNTFGARTGFCVNWVNVGAFSQAGSTGPAYSAQLLIMNRGSGAVDLIFNYDDINAAVSTQKLEIGYADPQNRANSLRVSGSGTSPTTFSNVASASRILSKQDGSPYDSALGRYVFPITAAGSPTATATPSPTPTTTATITCPTAGPDGSQPCAPWGLDRIDQAALPLNSLYYAAGTGANVKAYVVDTGIAVHQEFTGRLLSGYSAIGDGNGTTDCNSHGTHVAGTIGGTTYGVAKLVSLVPVRVLDCDGSGSTSSVIAGIDWSISNHTTGPAVMNLSLGGSYSKSLNDSIAAAVNDGISVSVAAGNSNVDACSSSPASEPTAITVGATDPNDARASFSNYGPCLDIFAPGVTIISAGIASQTAAATMSGTSMASPHVAGAAAVYLGLNPTASPATVATALSSAATANVVTSAGAGSPNLLLYARSFSPSTSTPTATPTSTSNGGGGSPSGGSGSGGSGGGSSGGGSSGGGSGGGALQTITELRPAIGPLSGGNTVAIIGYGFTGATKVTIGSKDAQFTVVNDAFVSVVMPAGNSVGSADVAVVLTPARGRAFAPGGYVYEAVTIVPGVPVAPTKPGEVGILSRDASAGTVLSAVFTPISRPVVTVSSTGVVNVRVLLPRSAANLRAQLMKSGKSLGSATVSKTGSVTFSGKKIKSGSYTVAVKSGTTTKKSTPIAVKVPKR